MGLMLFTVTEMIGAIEAGKHAHASHDMPIGGTRSLDYGFENRVSHWRDDHADAGCYQGWISLNFESCLAMSC